MPHLHSTLRSVSGDPIRSG